MSTEPEVKATHAVIYTDGGCRPSRGIGGWGIHGYFFNDEPAKQGTGNAKAAPTPNGYVKEVSGKPTITVTHYVDGFGSLIPESTNNIAEITAAIMALQTAKKFNLQDVKLIMDSQYVLQGLTEWLPNWVANSFMKPGGLEKVSNAELWQDMHEIKTQMTANGVNLSFGWVKGHAGDFGNELADQNATRGVIAGRNRVEVEYIKVEDSKGYWNNKNERNRLFSHPQWFFGTQQEAQGLSADGRHVYYLGDPREDDELLGKKIADATFSILYLKEPEPVLSIVRDTVAKMGMGVYQGLSIGRLTDIFNPDIYNEIRTHGDMLLVRDHERQRVSTAQDVLLTKEIRPARLAYHAVDALQSLEGLLKDYLSPVEGSLLRTTDITDLLYESDTSKKKPVYKLKSHITSALRSLEVKARYAIKADPSEGETKLVLTLGLDLPDRNTLAALAGEGIKVTVLTWPESQRAIRYATVVEASGDVGIWSGIYANLHILAS